MGCQGHMEYPGEWEDMEERAISFIRFNLLDEVLVNVMDEETGSLKIYSSSNSRIPERKRKGN